MNFETMINWICENKTWLFSGTGVAVVSGIAFLVKHLWSHKKTGQHHSGETKKNQLALNNATEVGQSVTINQYNQISTNQDTCSLSKTPTQSPQLSRGLIYAPTDIMAKIKSSPPYRRDDICNDYIGVSIRSHGTYHSLHKKYNDNEIVCIDILDGGAFMSPTICFEVSIADYPDFKTMPKGTPLCVEGQIKGIRYETYIDIENVNIDFSPSPPILTKRD